MQALTPRLQTATNFVIIRLSKHKLIQRQLPELFPPVRRVTREEVIIDGSGHSKSKSTEFEDDSQIEPLHHQTQAIANHLGWTDLVNIDDYFERQQQWSTLED